MQRQGFFDILIRHSKFVIRWLGVIMGVGSNESQKKPVSSIDLNKPKPPASGFTPAINDDRQPAYKRIILKLSGEMLGG